MLTPLAHTHQNKTKVRHPNVLAFKDSAEAQEKGQAVVYLVTEAVKPLSDVLRELDLSGAHR